MAGPERWAKRQSARISDSFLGSLGPCGPLPYFGGQPLATLLGPASAASVPSHAWPVRFFLYRLARAGMGMVGNGVVGAGHVGRLHAAPLYCNRGGGGGAHGGLGMDVDTGVDEPSWRQLACAA